MAARTRRGGRVRERKEEGRTRAGPKRRRERTKKRGVKDIGNRGIRELRTVRTVGCRRRKVVVLGGSTTPRREGCYGGGYRAPALRLPDAAVWA